MAITTSSNLPTVLQQIESSSEFIEYVFNVLLDAYQIKNNTLTPNLWTKFPVEYQIYRFTAIEFKLEEYSGNQFVIEKLLNTISKDTDDLKDMALESKLVNGPAVGITEVSLDLGHAMDFATFTDQIKMAAKWRVIRNEI